MTKATVWKYPLEFTDGLQRLALPVGAQVLLVAKEQDSRTPALWARVDPDAHPVTRCFQMFGTGDTALPAEASHVGTVQDRGFVWHWFEVQP